MKRTKRGLACLICAALLAALLPTAAFAAEGHWAAAAVDTLNGIYGDGVFTASDAEMTEGEAYTVLQSMGCESTQVTKNSTTELTRGTACNVLAEVFQLPLGEKQSAIEYLYEQNIINGYADGTLGPDYPITKAQFAVITYRVLNSVGGGLGSGIDTLKPGTKEYFSWMYLKAKGCLDYQDSEEQPQTDAPTDKMDNDTLTRWKKQLSLGDDFTMNLETETTKADAAVEIVIDQLQITQVFPDVSPDDWYYDGVMYLFDHKIVFGYSDGRFGPEDRITRADFAAILFRADGNALTEEESKTKTTCTVPWAVNEAKAAVARGYMKETSEAGWWSNVTREEAIVGIMKMCEHTKSISTEQLDAVNTDILDRFSDQADISKDAEKYIAYAVSLGIISGNADGELLPNAELDRGTAGVILYRTLIGVDTTKMKDYEDNVDYAKEGTAAATFALRAVRTSGNVLTLREDWRLTSDLDLAVAEGETLTINGGGHYIYEMGGRLLNSGLGTVTFTEDTILYPAAGDANAAKVVTTGIWDTEESNRLMLVRQGIYIVVIDETIANGTVTADATTAKANDTVTLTVTPASGYELDTLTVTQANGSAVTVSNKSFTMPASGVTVSATFKKTDSGSVVAKVETGDLTEVPGELSGTYKSVNELTTVLQTAVIGQNSSVSFSNIVVYDVTLMVDMKDGNGWVEADATHFPSNGKLTVTLDYPEGTDSSYTFTVVHMFTTNVFGKTPGGMEIPKVTNTPNGIQFEVTGLSPIAVGWVAPESSATAPTYTVSVSKTENGTLKVTPREAEEGDLVFLTVTPDEGYELEELIVTTRSGRTVKLNDRGDGRYTFIMPDSRVTVSVSFAEIEPEPTTTNRPGLDELLDILTQGGAISSVTPTRPTPVTYVDVARDAWYYDAVQYVSRKSLMGGSGSAETFQPEQTTTRAMLVTILYRLEGKPAVTSATAYSDVPAGQYYTDAVAWATRTGIVTGYDGAFRPDDELTRQDMATILYRYAAYKGYPVSASADLSGYADATQISAYAANAMAWANAQGLITGDTAATLAPQTGATRAVLATILMRFCENVAK